MKEQVFENLSGRNELIQILVEGYKKNYFPVVAITGNHGCGKSFVAYEIINKLSEINNVSKKFKIFLAHDDKLILFNPFNNLTVENVEVSISLPFSWGMGLNFASSIKKNKESDQYNCIHNLLKSHFTTNILICIPRYIDNSSKIKLLINMLISNYEYLQKDFKHNLFFLITGSNEECLHDFMCFSNIFKAILKDYDENDIYNYLLKKHSLSINKKLVQEKLQQIKKICASNLKLVDFLYNDFIERDLEFFRALDTIVTYRLNHLKKSAIKYNISEHDMEDIILSASLSLKKFGSREISCVTHRDTRDVYESLVLAHEQTLLKKESSNYFLFVCDEIQYILKKELINKKKERYLDFYNFYTNEEQDQYYLRAYYLLSYTEHMNDQIFALFILALSEAYIFLDISKINKVDKVFKTESSYYYEDYENILYFLQLINENSEECQKVIKYYFKIQQDYFELVLKAELARAFFHYLYQNQDIWNKYLKNTLDFLMTYVTHELYIEHSEYPVHVLNIDESLIRLRIMYDIAPYVLDSQNDVESFQKIYDSIVTLSNNTKNLKSDRGLAQYMENVFNRKAFLFINQMQCSVYYNCAKKYFLSNQIWDEYCITLICEAGTNIVAHKYQEAINACKKAKKVADEKKIIIPLPQKLKNNFTIALFLKYEQNHDKASCQKIAKTAIKVLDKNLVGKSCATEYVIITNICSLSLYVEDISSYMNYKQYLEKLLKCKNISDIYDDDIDDFYRYYFAWFEIYRAILEDRWQNAEELACGLHGFVPALFQKQEVFWEKKILALNKIIQSKKKPSGYDFARNLVNLKRRESELAFFFCRGLMLSDLQYTSYN